jgi:hypothetical protein
MGRAAIVTNEECGGSNQSAHLRQRQIAGNLEPLEARRIVARTCQHHDIQAGAAQP